MKLKGKLISSFASVVVSTLVVFGLITYYTFAESTKSSANQIVKLNHSRIILEIKSHFTDKINEMYHVMAPDLPLILDHTIELAKFSDLLRPVAAREPYTPEIAIYNFRRSELISISQDTIKPEVMDVLSKMAPSADSRLLVVGDNLYLLAPMTKELANVALFLELDKQSFINFLKSFISINKSVLYLSESEKLLVPPLFRDLDLDTSVLDYGELPLSATEKEHIDLGNAGQIYRFPETLFGAKLTYLIPSNFFTTNVVVLKNRIITAMLIVCWLALWVILVLAHKIASPIKVLTKSTEDIVAFNYSNPIEVGSGNDEITELARNFEAMRLKLKDLVTKDQLTHVFNRRFLTHLFELAVLKAIRLDEQLCCIMVDIDFFKKVNDTYGHQAGDYVLVEMGKVLHEYTRDYDSPARYGGEEFILILPETSSKTAVEVAERIRKGMEKRVMTYEDQQIQCTLSMGVAVFDKYEMNTTEKLIQSADKALYEAKETGRNKTVLSQSVS